MKAKFKHFVINSLCLCFFAMACLFALLYIYDPLQIYHKPYFREISFSDDMRVQDKGIIKHYDFDSFILGTSMVMSTSAREAGEKLGGKWVNVSLAGGSFNQRAVILRYIYAQKPEVKRVIWSLDIAQTTDIKPAETKSFNFLYDKNELDDIRIYVNKKFISCALSFSKAEKCVGKKDLETLIYWATRPEQVRKFGGFENWLKNSKEPVVQSVIKNLKKPDITKAYIQIPPPRSEANEDYINRYLLSFAAAHPETKFDLIISPYSRLWYRMESPEIFAKFSASLLYLTKEIKKYPNVKIYGFDDLNFPDDIVNYADPIHFHQSINSLQLDAIKADTHRITSENVDAYLATLLSKIQAYDLTPLIEMIKAWENNATK